MALQLSVRSSVTGSLASKQHSSPTEIACYARVFESNAITNERIVKQMLTISEM